MTCQQNLFPTKWSMAIFIAMVILAGGVLAVGQTERVVYRFHGGNDGQGPLGGLISDNAGNLYGTTSESDASSGTVFQLSPSVGQGGHWTKTILYTFTGGNDGGDPYGELVFDQAGNLYGTTLFGGTADKGTIFQLKPLGSTWTETVIYSFNDQPPQYGGLVFDKAGNLYGATCADAENRAGTVFQLTLSQGGWTTKVIHAFGGRQGGCPSSGPIIGRAGNLYGLIAYTGKGSYGGAYELRAPATKGGNWTYRLLHIFQGSGDGAYPAGRLMLDRNGNLNGVTQLGGSSNMGTVFQLTRQGTSWAEAVLYSFCAQSSCSDGAQPQAGLISDGKGNLYGTTPEDGSGGGGTVFQLTPPAVQGDPWTETVLHHFTGQGGDGAFPVAPLLREKFGTLWSTTSAGGGAADGGTVFKILP